MSNKRKKEPTIKQENILEAVVIADSFNKRFYPVTAERPRCLFPVANQPLISYTLEFLSICGVKHIYVYACHCYDQVKRYVQQSKWANAGSPCTVTVVCSQSLTSVGDVLREVDQKTLFKTDFLVVPGDVVSNMQLATSLKEHRARREKDKNAPLMTLVLRTSSPTHRSRTAEDDIVLALDQSTNRVLHYHRFLKTQSKVNFPLSIFQGPGSRVELRYDLIDTGISVCSPQVPQLFTDNFDYQTQYDLVKGVLINEEFLGNQIHAHIEKSRYCSRVYNFHSYDVVSHDILSRWSHPFVPENTIDEPIENCKSGDCFFESYSLLRHNVYLHNTCTLGQNSVVLDCSLIGRGTRIGKRCKISNSVVGNNCHIHDDCIIDGSYIWDNSTIGSNCKISKSFICDGVQVHDGVIVHQGSVLCDMVHVGPKVDLDSGSVVHLSTLSNDDFDSDELQETRPYDIGELGDEGRGYMWGGHEGSESGSDASLVMQMWGLSLQEHNKLKQDQLGDHDGSESELSSLASRDEEDNDPIILDDDLSTFQKEVKESLCGGIEENIQCDNLVLEINSSKYAYNMSVKDVVQTVTRSLLEIATDRTSNSAHYFSTVKKILAHYIPLLLNYNKHGSSQLDCIYTLEEFALNSEPTFNCLVKILMYLYESDVLSEEVILHWNSNPRKLTGIFSTEEVRNKVEKFIEWLEEAEEEDSDDD